MQFIRDLLGRKKRPSALTTIRDRDSHRQQTRRELLSMALRDTLKKNGIPQSWISVETQVALTNTRERGIHLRLVLHECQPGVVQYAIPLQRAVTARLHRLDPLSASWMTGVSWRFAVSDTSLPPELPPPSHWAAGSGRSEAPRKSVSLPRRQVVADFGPTQPMPRT